VVSVKVNQRRRLHVSRRAVDNGASQESPTRTAKLSCCTAQSHGTSLYYQAHRGTSKSSESVRHGDAVCATVSRQDTGAPRRVLQRLRRRMGRLTRQPAAPELHRSRQQARRGCGTQAERPKRCFGRRARWRQRPRRPRGRQPSQRRCSSRHLASHHHAARPPPPPPPQLQARPRSRGCRGRCVAQSALERPPHRPATRRSASHLRAFPAHRWRGRTRSPLAAAAAAAVVVEHCAKTRPAQVQPVRWL
jgi:hypothetical protein